VLRNPRAASVSLCLAALRARSRQSKRHSLRPGRPRLADGTAERFQALQRLWITRNENNRFDLSRLLLWIANVEQIGRDDVVRSLVGDSPRIHFLQGRFPETASAIPAEERFAFVHLDCDLYAPMKAGLEYFYTRMSPGGAILLRDYGSGSWPGVTRACDEFCRSVGVRLVLLPDKSGSALLITPRSDPRIAPCESGVPRGEA